MESRGERVRRKRKEGRKEGGGGKRQEREEGGGNIPIGLKRQKTGPTNTINRLSLQLPDLALLNHKY
jgi:hypothetical protein